MPHSPSGETVTSRALRVLATFSAQRRELTLSDLARLTGLPLTTTHRLVGELATWGALERDEQGLYRIGLRLWEIAALAPRSVGLREAALPFLEDLYEATHENVHLAVRDGDEALYVERISGRHAVSVVSRVGGRLPLHATGVGLVLLAYADVEVQERVMAGPLRRFTDRTVTSPPELRRLLAEVRRTRTAISPGYLENNALSVAAPVWGPAGDVVAALSIVVPISRAPGPFLPAVTAAARGVSRALGARL
ncbi:transcriptional regulator, IclR family [Micromonospora pattaloongensis]|uniref:Glycerol operon regulatory protein n=1 Tax=Micromonospora pattaloongensis TaxID=405436 RepID=A0A1H3FJ70_9ACTN|nr:IclR family transcriptional regulator [Micromonospora pattaloongensis]SDX90837.1 transcriptional regulator, IclR family [Micromonospora pattaloongensis]